MSVFPVLLDAAPSYLHTASKARSLLLTPMGSGRLICRLHERFLSLGKYSLAVLPSFFPDLRYQKELRDACHEVTRVMAADEFSDFLATLEPSDYVLFLDPKCMLLEGVDPDVLLQACTSLRSAVHLIALETNAGGTYEWVDVDDHGDVTRIQRFYDEVTWSHSSGVIASLVPVPSLLTARGLQFDSLGELRATLSSRGVPARDVSADGRAFDLTHEHELLTMTERVVRAAHAETAGFRRPHRARRDGPRLRSPARSGHRAGRRARQGARDGHRAEHHRRRRHHRRQRAGRAVRRATRNRHRRKLRRPAARRHRKVERRGGGVARAVLRPVAHPRVPV